MCSADGSDDLRFVQKGLDRGDELGGEFFAALGNESRQVVTFEMLPKAFDGVEVGTVRRKVDRFDVMPVESLDLVPAGIVENQHTPSTRSRRSFLCHRVEEYLEDIAIAVWNDQADKLTAFGMDRSQDVFPDMLAEVPLSDSFAAPGPLPTRSRVAFEPGFVTKGYVAAIIVSQVKEFIGKACPLVLPVFPIRRLGHGPRDFELVVVFVKVSHQRAVGDGQILLVLEPAHQFRGRPVALASQRGGLDQRQDHLGNQLFGNGSGPPRFGPIGQRVDACLIEA